LTSEKERQAENGDVSEPETVEEAEAEETSTLDDTDRLQQELAEAKEQAAEYLDGWQRAQAEFSNYRKRREAERAQMMQGANADLLRKLLPIVDDFERALVTLPPELEQSTWRQGVVLIKQKLDTVLRSEGVELIETEGQEFDPRYHEAVTYEEAEGFEEGQIIGEEQRGYLLGDRVLRPALVRVAKQPSPPPADEDQAPESDVESEA
jgi:molecular chaperone GrpE